MNYNTDAPNPFWHWPSIIRVPPPPSSTSCDSEHRKDVSVPQFSHLCGAAGVPQRGLNIAPWTMILCVSCFRNLETLRREALLKCNGITPLFQCPGMCFYTDPVISSSRRRTPLPKWKVISSDTFPHIPPSPKAKRDRFWKDNISEPETTSQGLL